MVRVRAARPSWRAAADPEDLREYDRFGPWLDPIASEQELPRRFRSCWAQVRDARFLIKVPRPIDRDQARPGMDLYRAVLAVFPDRIRMLELDQGPEGPAVRTREVSLDRVVATTSSTNLLRGRWSLLLADGTTFDVEYNTVSKALVAEVDVFVRGGPSRLPVTVPSPAERLDLCFAHVLRELTAVSGGPLRPIHVEEPGRPCRDASGRRRLGTGLMVLDSPTELVLVNRGAPMRSRFPWARADYAANVLSIRYARMSSFRVVAASPDAPGRLHQLQIISGAQVMSQACLDRPDRVGEVLTAHGIGRAFAGDRDRLAARGRED